MKMETNWEGLSPEEKREIRYQRWLSSEKTPFASKEAQQAFIAREKRLRNSIEFKVPDRVPIWFQDLSFFPAKYTGITFQEMMYNSGALVTAYKKTILDFEPDMYFRPPVPVPGEALEILGCKQLKWPGGGLPSDCPFQYVEGEYMKADEYDAFINDPTDYAIRTYLPRCLSTMKPLETLPPLKHFLKGYMGLPIGSAFLKPEVISSFKSFFRAGLLMQKHEAVVQSFHQDMRKSGFPEAFGASTLPPFDILSDTLRGMRGVMLDMYRQPDKLLEAIEKITPFQIESVISGANKSDNPRAMLTMHRGADSFMSASQWETFYWPGYKKIVMAIIDEGLTPLLFLEGNVTSRLQYFAEFPKGKILGLFDSTDIFKAKEILGNTMCLSGMMPLSLLQTGTPDEVKAYARKLIDVCGKGGGFIMGPRSVMDEANPALVKIWFDYTKEYGAYQ
jgi:hypothetical protein